MNAGADILISNSSQHLTQEYASILLAEGHTLKGAWSRYFSPL